MKQRSKQENYSSRTWQRPSWQSGFAEEMANALINGQSGAWERRKDTSFTEA